MGPGLARPKNREPRSGQGPRKRAQQHEYHHAACARACLTYVTCVASPTRKKKKKASDKSSTGSTSTPVFTIFRNSAIAPASPLIRKSTTLRPTLWCSNCSVTKRQQFSCPLGTATLSLKWVNVVPGRWICSLSYRGRIFLTAPTWMSSSRTYEYFSNSFVR